MVEPAFLGGVGGLAWWFLSFAVCLFEAGGFGGRGGGSIYLGCRADMVGVYVVSIGGGGRWVDGLDVRWSFLDFLDWPVVIGGTRIATNY